MLGVSKKTAILPKSYITDGFIDHLFYLFETFYSHQPVTANNLSTCISPSPHQPLSNVVCQWGAVYFGLTFRAGAFAVP